MKHCKKDELQQAEDTGTLCPALYSFLATIRFRLHDNTQLVEGKNKEAQNIVDAAENIAMPLLCSRFTTKCELANRTTAVQEALRCTERRARRQAIEDVVQACVHAYGTPAVPEIEREKENKRSRQGPPQATGPGGAAS